MGVITKSKYNNRYLLDKFPNLRFENKLDIIVLENTVVEDLLIIYADGNIQCCNSIVTGISVNYEE